MTELTEPQAAADPRSTVDWTRDADGIVTLTLDAPDGNAVTEGEFFTASLAHTVDRLVAEQDEIRGVVITSARETFRTGNTLGLVRSATPETAAETFQEVERVKGLLRRLERLGKPVVAALGGSALGSGLELALACHRRIASDDPRIEFGFPEVTLGLLPGAGGVVRTVRMLGLTTALRDVLLKGRRHRPAEALELGLIDEVVPADRLLDAARAWIRSGPDPVQPWEAKGYRIPGGTPASPSLASVLPSLPSSLRKELKGAPFPAPGHILSAAVESTQVDVDTALTVESRYLVDLMTHPVSRNMTKAFTADLAEVAARLRPEGHRARPVERVGVLGAGTMGAAIAYECAKAGIDVVLKDVSSERAEKGTVHCRELVEKAVARGRSTQDEGDTLLARITPTDDPADLAGAEIVIEAVFEEPSVKHRVLGEIQDVVASGALLASTTSALPITLLAEGVTRQENVIGLHFLPPGDRMPLVEVVRGAKTSEESVARALDFVTRLHRTPIVVNDGSGFFTTRVINTFVQEGVAMIAEGVPPATVEQASAQAGYPTPVLQLTDELTLSLLHRIRQETPESAQTVGGARGGHPADAVIARMIDEFGRPGRSMGAGFYEYDETGARARLWPGLAEHFGGRPRPPFEDLKERMLFIEALESVRCLEEGILTSAADANIGSILGIGFPAWTGGVLQYINQYAGGLPGFVARAEQFMERYGDRFAVPALLRQKAERREGFD
ncbi:3-hydroxyacyl-CoA dehydrogenase NAD-binding domain-containing protein [Streptomyces griseorubiginosus]|uniref:3-hydroxyacyl-CoA dehydrogenase NAD-binding domain-containing protein n=1 Tax=Streptomyces griseorubiginosus TaxID=67304 RepID=UPI0011403236|nr:3-hydroxyacyl-CoA dehydrogenase NAD-binding domain-containing protein [Streptomyces griseorubiginosus]